VRRCRANQDTFPPTLSRLRRIHVERTEYEPVPGDRQSAIEKRLTLTSGAFMTSKEEERPAREAA
jgi:hypothetical protein